MNLEFVHVMDHNEGFGEGGGAGGLWGSGGRGEPQLLENFVELFTKTRIPRELPRSSLFAL